MFALVAKVDGQSYRNSDLYATRASANAAARYYAKRNRVCVQVVDAGPEVPMDDEDCAGCITGVAHKH